MKVKTQQTLGTNQGEWSTERIFVSGGKFFLVTDNGGERGSRQENNKFPSTLEGPTEIDKAKALALLGQWGYEEIELPD